MRAVIDGALRRAPISLGPYRASRWSYLGKIWTGNSDLHYEVWPRPRLDVLEIGLHFEADALTNARLLGAFRARQAEVRAALGDAPRIEAWDKGWSRVYETHTLADDRAQAERLAVRLAAYVRALEPILREELPADLPWATLAGERRRGRYSPRPREPRRSALRAWAPKR